MSSKRAAVVILLLLLGAFGDFSFVGASADDYEFITINTDGAVYPSVSQISTSDEVTYTFTGNFSGRLLVLRDNVVIDGNGYTLNGEDMNNEGVLFSGVENVTLRNLQIINCSEGVEIKSSSNVNLTANKIVSNKIGVTISSSAAGNNICDNNISTNAYYGITISSSNNQIIGNDLSGNANTGIQIMAQNNTISGNNVSESPCGVTLGVIGGPCMGNNIAHNNITNNDYGMWLGSSSNPANAYNNTVNDNNITLSHTACVIAQGSSNNTFTGNTLTSTTGGFGFGMVSSSNNTFFANTVTNTSVGVELMSSSCGNSICGNNLTNHVFGGIGVSFTDSGNNAVVGNNFYNGYCVKLQSSSQITFYHNTFRGTASIVTVLSWSINTWDNGYPSGGNYWWDYQTKYPSASEVDESGIWSEPYAVDANNQDNYPLMQQHATAQSPVPNPAPTVTPSSTPTPTPQTTYSPNPTNSATSTPKTTPIAPEFPSSILLLTLLITVAVTAVVNKKTACFKQARNP